MTDLLIDGTELVAPYMIEKSDAGSILGAGLPGKQILDMDRTGMGRLPGKGSW
ncbi:MAG: hypothetical protein BroJett015_44980 [Chloroflexota bacterium]|nr:MAG: hypothetical protein BroJett015_44980 [Chloroflexota bacterium]